MDLQEFKTIFWWEYIHRLWGRLIGLVFFVPFAWFLWRGSVRGPLAWKLAGIFALGGLQGAMGWYMVASGLVDRPEVSQYRLVAHLGLALLIYALLLWQGLRLSHPSSESPLPLREGARGRGDAAASSAALAPSDSSTRRPLPLSPSLEGRGDRAGLRRAATALVALVTLTILAGGFVAGLDAGMIYNSFPLMEGRIVPPDYGYIEPWWRDWFENRATVQFHHRVLAITTLVAVLAYVAHAMRQPLPTRARRAAIALAHVVMLQVALGIATLLLVVPVPLAALHQAGAMALLTAALWLRFELRRG